MIQRRLVAVLFACVTLLHLVPTWSVRYVPTVDGPSHVYNAWVLQALVRGTAPPAVDAALAVRRAFFPNWLGHAALAAAVAVAGPLLGEKLFLSLLILALAASAWYLAGALAEPSQHAAAFLIFPVITSWPMQMGFHGFCLGIALDLALFGYAARHARAPRGRDLVRLAGGLAVALLLHPVAFAIGASGIALLWVVGFDGAGLRPLAQRAALLLPVVLVGVWFLYSRRATLSQSDVPLVVRLRYLLECYSVYTLFPAEVVFGRVAGALVAGLAIVAASRGPRLADRRTAPFLVLALALGAVYLIAPATALGGSLLGPRLALYPALALIPWLAGRLPVWAGHGAAVAFSLWASLHVAALLPAYRAADFDVRTYLAGLAPVAAGSSLEVDAQPAEEPSGRNVPLYLHAAGYAGAEKGLLLWPNYELDYPIFPIRRRLPAAGAPGVEGVVDYVYGWKLAPDSPVRNRLQDFEPLATTDAGGALYQRKTHSAER